MHLLRCIATNDIRPNHTMKRLIVPLLLFVCCLAAPAQNIVLDAFVGKAVDHSWKVDSGLNLKATFPVASRLEIGVGAGLHFNKGIWRKVTSSKGETKWDHDNEFAVPVFGELKYTLPTIGKHDTFALLDIGYSFVLASYFEKDWIPGGPIDPVFTGFFAEPQVGMDLGANLSLSLVLLLQSCAYRKYHEHFAVSGLNGSGVNFHTDDGLLLAYIPSLHLSWRF